MARPDDPRTAAARMFPEGGACGELLAGIDWAATPLGPPECWPWPLVDTLRLMLTSEQGLGLYWGAEFTTLYKLRAAPIRGAAHPCARSAGRRRRCPPAPAPPCAPPSPMSPPAPSLC